jgi:hypothetical protein
VHACGGKRGDDALASWSAHNEKDPSRSLPEANELRSTQKEPVRLGQ